MDELHDMTQGAWERAEMMVRTEDALRSGEACSGCGQIAEGRHSPKTGNAKISWNKSCGCAEAVKRLRKKMGFKTIPSNSAIGEKHETD